MYTNFGNPNRLKIGNVQYDLLSDVGNRKVVFLIYIFQTTGKIILYFNTFFKLFDTNCKLFNDKTIKWQDRNSKLGRFL